MIQDIFPDRFENRYAPLEVTPESPLLVFQNERLLARYDEEARELVFPACREFEGEPSAVYLFAVGETHYFLAADDVTPPAGYEWYTMQDVRRQRRRSNTGIFVAFTAYHLWKWYESSKFCGACGEKTEYDSKERAKVCPRCQNRIYPRINPAVIVGVTNGDRLLLTRYRVGYGYNALVAGFTEIGETLEETVRREVMEEVGLKVKNIRYYKSQPWGIASDLLAGFYCDVDGDDTIRRDDGELRYAAWVPRGEIELQPSDISLTNEMMRMFRDGKVGEKRT